MSEQDVKKTADYWDARRAAGLGARAQWWDLRAVNEYRNRLLSGKSDDGFEEYIRSQYFDADGSRWKVLSLGCGIGKLERRLAELGMVESAQGVDVGEDGLRRAREAAAEAGHSNLEYAYADLNSAQFAPDSFDAVFAAGIVHHLSELEHVYAQVASALRPGGWFFLDEYVGPNRFQFPRRQRELIEEAFRAIPARFRALQPPAAVSARAGLPLHALHPRLLIPKIRDGRLLDAIRYRLSLLRADSTGASGPPVLEKPRFPTAADVAAGDPSEAVRSEEIVAQLERRFDIVEQKGTGLSILQFLLADIAGNFVGEDPEAAEVLDGLIAREAELLDGGELAHDFVFLAAQPKDCA